MKVAFFIIALMVFSFSQVFATEGNTDILKTIIVKDCDSVDQDTGLCVILDDEGQTQKYDLVGGLGQGTAQASTNFGKATGMPVLGIFLFLIIVLILAAFIGIINHFGV